MKEQLLEFMEQALEADFLKLPNVVFMVYLKEELRKHAVESEWKPRPYKSINDVISPALENINVNFSAFGMECSEEDDKYLLELATVTAKFVWKLYNKVGMEFDYKIFVSQPAKGL